METCAGIDMEFLVPLIACLSDPEGHDGINRREGSIYLGGRAYFYVSDDGVLNRHGYLNRLTKYRPERRERQ